MKPEELAAFDFVKACREVSEKEDQIRSYVTQSELFRAICRYIENAKVCYIIDRDEENPVASYRASSSVHYRDCHLYAPDWGSRASHPEAKPKEADVFRLLVYVDYFDAYDVEVQRDRPQVHMRNYELNVPLALLKDFTVKGFDAWVAQCKKDAVKDLPEKELKALEILVKKYPKGANALIQSLKRSGTLD